MDERNTRKPEDLVKELDDFEVGELDDKDLEGAAGGNDLDSGNTNCGCGGKDFTGGSNNTNCGCGPTGPSIEVPIIE